MTARELSFHKGQALGNDYLIVESDALPWPLSPARAAAFCDRHRGAGSDGVLVVTIEESAAALAPGRGESRDAGSAAARDAPGIRLSIVNPDGSEAEKSGNGLRILAAYLHARGVVGTAPFTVTLPHERVPMRVLGTRADGGVNVEVGMGRARFGPAAVRYRGPERIEPDAVAARIARELDVSLVSVGNPHCVVFPRAWQRTEFLEAAPALAVDPGFERGVNVQFARVADARTLDLWIWERGVGETEASGSSATAAAAAAVARGLIEPGAVQVRMRGGDLTIGVQQDGDLRLTGPAWLTFEGRIAAPIVAAWAALSE